MPISRINKSIEDLNFGNRYEIVLEEQHCFSFLRSSARTFLATVAVVCSLGLACLSKPIRRCFIKGRKISRFAKVLNQKIIIGLVKFIALQDGRGVSKYIKNGDITDQEDLIEIAKLAAQQNGKGLSEHIWDYCITDQEALIEIAKLAALQDGWGISEYIWNYRIIDQKALIEIAKIAAQKDGSGVSKYIKNYGIVEQKDRIEVAKFAAQKDGWGISLFIEGYEITEQEALVEIAKLAALQDAWSTSKYIKNYNITEQKALIEIVSLAIKMSISDSAVLDFWDYLPNYCLSKEELEKCRLLYACLHILDVIRSQSMQEFIAEHAKSCQFSSLDIFNQKITEIEKQISIEQDLHKLEKLQKKKQRALLYALLISEKCKDLRISLTEDQQGYFIKALEYRNQKESGLLMQILVQNFGKPGYFSNYQELVGSKKYLILPMILINQWLIESLDPSDIYRKTLTQIEDFLGSRQQRDSLRYAKGFLPNLLQALIALSHSSSISLKQKFYLLSQCFQFALSVKGKEWEGFCKKALDTVSILASMNLLAIVLEELGDKYSFEEVLTKFKAELQTDIFAFSEPTEGFYEKYFKIEKTLRIPLVLVKYASNLKSNKEASVSQEFQRLVIHILEGSVKQERYQTKNNLHLQKIQKDFPEVFQAWQISQEAIEIKLGEAKQQSMDFFAFLKQKILIDKHLPQAPFALTQYLKEQTYSIKNMKESDQQIVLLCEELCNNQSADFTEKLTVLESLYSLLGQNEFKNDIDSLYTILKTTHQQKSVLVVNSDDWQDLFLSGTEVLGSCQRINGDPHYNVCLMAYVLDGKNRILCIKDPVSGKILARCIFRLLFKDNELVLFQERIYPCPCPRKHEELLNKQAQVIARELGCKLFTCNEQDNLESGTYVLESLGSCSPYEYADAAEGKTNGVFRIDRAKKVILSSEN